MDEVSCHDCKNSDKNGLGKKVHCYAEQDGSYMSVETKNGKCKFFELKNNKNL